ncbi:OLC1v1018530C1 [Oldenlandia corymbosa var. corymbosa]|uniref:OLC1v1018530C1 n=1 Tax=Oldenlandia corymbosa var. corymbosa TaxID=529605 RepID=A0AAV1EBW8_OLDCO|nr:OLC1v1018530C1 [Oldenlandia corymbosa var. corymbosa]
MEEYLQHMKTLRTQMNEVEDQAAKISVEEQMHLSTVQNLEKDLLFVKDETKRVKAECESIMKSKGIICSGILEKQRKISSLESDSYNLSQTLDLLQQENVTLSARLEEKSSYYTEVVEDIASKIKDKQDWINAHKHSSLIKENGLVSTCLVKTTQVEDKSCSRACETEEFQPNELNSIMSKVDAAKAKLDQMSQMKNTLVLENSKINQSMELVKVKMGNFEVSWCLQLLLAIDFLFSP